MKKAREKNSIRSQYLWPRHKFSVCAMVSFRNFQVDYSDFSFFLSLACCVCHLTRSIFRRKSFGTLYQSYSNWFHINPLAVWRVQQKWRRMRAKSIRARCMRLRSEHAIWCNGVKSNKTLVKSESNRFFVTSDTVFTDPIVRRWLPHARPAANTGLRTNACTRFSRKARARAHQKIHRQSMSLLIWWHAHTDETYSWLSTPSTIAHSMQRILKLFIFRILKVDPFCCSACDTCFVPEKSVCRVRMAHNCVSLCHVRVGHVVRSGVARGASTGTSILRADIYSPFWIMAITRFNLTCEIHCLIIIIDVCMTIFFASSFAFVETEIENRIA